MHCAFIECPSVVEDGGDPPLSTIFLGGPSLRNLITGLAIAATLVGAATVAPASAKDLIVTASSTNFKFEPSTVMLKKGQTTTIHFKSLAGAHGLNVPELGINNLVIATPDTAVKVTPKKAGTYVAHCTIVCGAGHANMAMKFIVK